MAGGAEDFRSDQARTSASHIPNPVGEYTAGGGGRDEADAGEAQREPVQVRSRVVRLMV